MKHFGLVDRRRAFESELAEARGSLRRRDEHEADGDEHAFARGMLVGLPLSLVLWMVLVGLGFIVR